jgi:hypothetical protein
MKKLSKALTLVLALTLIFSLSTGLTANAIEAVHRDAGLNLWEGVLAGYMAGWNKNPTETIVVPEGVTKLGDKAFSGLDITASIQIIGSPRKEIPFVTLVLPSTLVEIGEGVLSNCDNLTTVSFPNGCNLTNIGDGSFGNNIKLVSFNMPNGAPGIRLPNTLTKIGAGVFQLCSVLPGEVTIPASVTEVGKNAFANTPKITAINYASGVPAPTPSDATDAPKTEANVEYVYVDKIMFTKDMTVLVKFPVERGGSYTIPSSVTTIADDAFKGCKDLTAVTIPNSVTSIGSRAFFGTGIKSLVIPDSVTYMGYNAFVSCKVEEVNIGAGLTVVWGYYISRARTSI